MTSRLSLLRQDIYQALRHLPHASPLYVKQRCHILLKLIDDLRAINRVIPSLKNLNKLILMKLINYWQEQDNDNNTIYRKVNILRNICMCHLEFNSFPTNLELGIKHINKSQNLRIVNNKSPDINNVAIDTIYRLQRNFGLKLTEALKIEPYMFDQQGLWLARIAAYNNKNRFIPYWHEEQRLFIDSFLSKANLLIDDKILISMQYKLFLKQMGILNKEYYRYQYIKHRYQDLLINDDLNHQNILKRLRGELGYCENKQIKAILTCLNDS